MRPIIGVSIKASHLKAPYAYLNMLVDNTILYDTNILID